MTIIRKIINWIKKIFRILFKKKNKITKKIKSTVNENVNKRYLKGYGVFVNDASTVSLPIYLMVTKEEKENIIKDLEFIENKIQEIHGIDKIDTIKSIKKVINKINNNKISFYQCNKINEKINSLLNDTKLEIDTSNKINSLSNDIFEVIDNYDKNVKDKTIKEYKKVNYVTLTTLLIDETKKEIDKLEEDYNHHKYNKYYYDREIKRIKDRINDLRKLRNNSDVIREIELLKKELYTKNKDKYDLLYNDEVFLNIEKYCDDILKKVNRKVVDIKKIKELRKETKEERQEKKEERKEEKKKKEENDELLENILKRFYDMELARKLLLLSKKDIKISNVNDLFSNINSVYYDFISGEKVKFNFERNKTKTELVKLYNGIGSINALLRNEEFLTGEHINYSMDDLLDATMSKKDELTTFLKDKYNYKDEQNEVSILVDNKLDIIFKNEEKRNNNGEVLVKKRKTNN